jgi:hypothetical protein
MRKILLSLSIATVTSFALAINLGFNQQDANAQTSTQKSSKWTSLQLLGAQKNCSDSAIKATKSKFTVKVADAYCACALGTAARRYEYLDFAKNEQKYTDLMTKEGVIGNCAKSAQEKK